MWLFQHKVFTIIKEIAATFRSNILLMLHLLLKICTINHFCTENQYHIDFLLSTKSLLQGIELVCFASPVDSRCFAEYTQARVHKPNFLLKSLESAAAVAFHTLAQKKIFSADCITRLLDHHLPTNFSRIWPSTLSLSTHNRAFTGQFGPRFLVHWKNRISPDFLFSELWIVATETFAMLRLIAVDKCSISSKVAEAAKLEAAKLIVFEEDFCGVWEGCWLLRRIQKNITPPQIACTYQRRVKGNFSYSTVSGVLALDWLWHWCLSQFRRSKRTIIKPWWSRRSPTSIPKKEARTT